MERVFCELRRSYGKGSMAPSFFFKFMREFKMKKRIIFICTHNSARSQMAEGILRTLYGDKFEVFSAGTEPTNVNPFAIEVMKEIGIDISKQRAKSVKEFLGEDFDLVVTVCDHAKESCPFFPGGKRYAHKGFEDPSQFKGNDEEILSGFRKVRDEIKEWIEKAFGEGDIFNDSNFFKR
jgi:arsenate reductase